MKSLLVILLHTILNTFFGLAVLRLLGFKKIEGVRIIQAYVIGIFVESTLGFLCLYQLIEEYWSLVIVGVIAVAYLIYGIAKKQFTISARPAFKFKWYELGLLLLIVQKLLSALYSLIKMPLYFDDAMTHWNGRARAIYGNVNWSIYSEDIHFMGQQLGYKEYPFLSSIWRANTAHINGSWNDLISRGDGLIFFLILLAGVYLLTKELSAPRWLRLSAVFIIASLPLQLVHVTSGYSEITLQALSVVAMLSLIRREWLVLGLILGAMIFTKNEGLLLYFPLFVGIGGLLILVEKSNFKTKLKAFASILIGALTLVVPWLTFKYSAGIPFSTPLKSENYYHPDSLGLFYEALFDSPSSSIFWIFVLVFSVLGLPRIIRSKQLAMLAAFVFLLLAAMMYIFCFTGANVFLVNQMTVHRSLLQIAPLAVVLVTGILAYQNKKAGAR